MFYKLFPLAGCLSLFATARTVPPSNLPLAHRAPTLDFTGASWIWTSHALPPNVEEPHTTRAFRKDLSYPAPPVPKLAEILVGMDDGFALYVNGNEIDDKPVNDYSTGYRYCVPLQAGTNVIAFRGYNTAGPAGLVVAVQVSFEDGTTTKFVTDASWKANLDVPYGFEQPDYDDSAWQAAVVEGPFPSNYVVSIPPEIDCGVSPPPPPPPPPPSTSTSSSSTSTSSSTSPSPSPSSSTTSSSTPTLTSSSTLTTSSSTASSPTASPSSSTSITSSSTPTSNYSPSTSSHLPSTLAASSSTTLSSTPPPLSSSSTALTPTSLSPIALPSSTTSSPTSIYTFPSSRPSPLSSTSTISSSTFTSLSPVPLPLASTPPPSSSTSPSSSPAPLPLSYAPSTTTSPTAIPPPSSSASTPSSSAPAPFTPASTSSPNDTDATAAYGNNKTGVIVGGVVGGGAAVSAAILALLLAIHIKYLVGSLAAALFGVFLFRTRRLVFIQDEHIGPTQITLFLSCDKDIIDSVESDSEKILVWKVFDLGNAIREFTVTVPCTFGEGVPQIGFGTVDDSEGVAVKVVNFSSAPAELNEDNTWEPPKEIGKMPERPKLFARNRLQRDSRIAVGTIDNPEAKAGDPEVATTLDPFLLIEPQAFKNGADYHAESDLYLHLFRSVGYRAGMYKNTLVKDIEGDKLTEAGIKIRELKPLTSWRISSVGNGNLKVEATANRKEDIKRYKHECRIRTSARRK